MTQCFKRACRKTNGFMKKTAKTPMKELDKAKQYRADDLERKGREK